MLYLLDELRKLPPKPEYTAAQLEQMEAEADCNDEGLSLNELLAKYAQSKTGEQIAELAGCGMHAVYSRAKKLGIEMRKPPSYDSDNVDQMIRKWAGQKTSTELAAMTGASTSTIKARAVRFGLSLRRQK